MSFMKRTQSKAMKKALVRSTALIAVFGVAACGTMQRDAGVTAESMGHVAKTTSDTRYPIQVADSKEEMTLVVAPHVFALNMADKKKVAWFAETYKHVGHGEIWVSAPVGSENAVSSIGAAAEVAQVMMERGIDPRAIKMHSYQAEASDASAPMTIYYKRYHAYTAPCGNFSDDLNFTPGNKTSRNFGCATQSNLAALVEDPQDLAAPRDLDPTDPARRATVFEKYRAGESTASERTEAESGVISEVADD